MSRPRLSLQDCFAGSLVGVALGDALGLPVEGSSHSECVAYVNALKDHWQDSDGGVPQLLQRHPGWGQYSDDTQMTREMVSAIVQYACLPPEAYAGRMLTLFRANALCGAGTTTKTALMKFARGDPWWTIAPPGGRPSNGCAMRVGPCGLLSFGDAARARDLAAQQSLLTHSHIRCQAGAALIATAVALATQAAVAGRRIEPRAFLAKLWEIVKDVSAEEDFQAIVERMLSAESPEEAVKLIPQPPADYKTSTRTWPVGTFVSGAVCWSLYCFLQSPEDYWASMFAAIEVGGDVDTTAAMAGAISGTYNGLAAIQRAPAFPGLFRQLRDEYTQRALGEAWDGADLVQLATQLRVVVELRPVVRRKRTAALSLLTVVTAGFLLFDRFCM